MKTLIIKLLLFLTIFFIAVWLIDMVLPSFNCSYAPLLEFLKVILTFLQVTGGLPA